MFRRGAVIRAATVPEWDSLGNKMRQICVNLGERSYNIIVDSDCLDGLGKHCVELGLRSPMAIVTDPTVRPLYAQQVVDSLEAAGFESQILEIPGGEVCKTLDTVSKLYDGLVAMRAERGSGLITLGGGLPGDIGGFVAATYLRGIPFIQVPTTLLAQTDASVGGKVAVDHPKGKNLIGAFWQPRLVYIDTTTLSTLPKRELLSGLAEVIKHGIIGDPSLFTFIEERLQELLEVTPATYAEMVPRNCRFKAKVVEQDEREGGLRAILNFGHTVGHAIESLTGYEKVLHGEGVAWGMLAEGDIAVEMGLLDETVLDRLWALIRKAGYPMDIPKLDADTLIDSMYLDKKVRDGEIRIVLPEAIGQVSVRSIKDTALLRKVWNRLLERADGG